MRTISSILHQLYDAQDAEKLEHRINALTEDMPKPGTIEKQPYWYKNLNFYIVYPDGVEGSSLVPLRSLREHLDWIKDLGCNAVHILPFLDSPMVDKGFDISDFYAVRKDLGSFQDLLSIRDRARELELQIFMDLVFNHVSDQHLWFQKAQAGDEHFRQYFFASKQPPKFIRRVHDEHGVMAEYEIDGAPKRVYIVFPETAGEIPHWRQGQDGYWYYHTFYPQQLDVNWFNPEVFYEFAKIIGFWASFGFHFRLDAIPFVGKGIYKDSDNTNTHLIVRALYEIARDINPNCCLLVESYESLESTVRYFGSTNQPEATMAYNFHLCASLWISLVRKDTTPFTSTVLKTQAVPAHAEWINFLRNHDELSISFVDAASHDDVVNALTPLGAPFRGGHAVSGRTFSLLGSDPRRHVMAYTLLASIPGTLGIPYGDELGMPNVDPLSLTEEDRKDSRNINRGMLSIESKKNPECLAIAEKLKNLLTKRRLYNYYFNARPEIIDMRDNQVFGISYTRGTSELLIVINISESEKHISKQFENGEAVLQLNQASFDGDTIRLGAYGCIWLQR